MRLVPLSSPLFLQGPTRLTPRSARLPRCSPALSEDAAFFAPAGQEGPEAGPSNGYNQAMADVGQQSADGLAEYYHQAMDLVRSSSLFPQAASPFRSHSLARSPAHRMHPSMAALPRNRRRLSTRTASRTRSPRLAQTAARRPSRA